MHLIHCLIEMLNRVGGGEEKEMVINASSNPWVGFVVTVISSIGRSIKPSVNLVNSYRGGGVNKRNDVSPLC
jgi:hypothetical protein